MELNLSIEMLEEKFSEIASIDEKLDAGTGRGHIALGNQIVAETSSTWQDFVDQVVEKVSALEGDDNIGAVIALDKEFSNLRKDVTEQLKSRMENTEVAQPSEEEKAALFEERKKLVEQFNAIKTMLETFNNEVPDTLKVRNRSAASGSRGPNVVSQFQYAIDGTNLPKENNSLAYVMKNHTEFEKTKQLKEFIKTEAGVILKKGEVPNEWEVKLPSGKLLSATRFDEFLVTNEDELDDDDDNESSDD